MATVPSPRSWFPGDVPNAGHFNADIRDAVNFFQRPPVVIVRNVGDVGIPWATWTALPWNTYTVDVDSNVVNTRMIANTSGIYYCFASIRWEWHADNTGARGVQIRKLANGGGGGGFRVCGDFRHSNNWQVTPNNRHGQTTSGYIGLNAGEYIECFVWHDQTNGEFVSIFDPYHPTPVSTSIYNADPNAATSVRFGMVWISQGGW